MNGRAAPVPGAPCGAAPGSVLQRALLLAEAGREATGLSAGDLRQVAAELEVPAWAVAVALAERQVCAGLPPAGAASRVVGPVGVVGWRHLPTAPGRAERQVAGWLEAGQALRVRRLGDGTLVATRRPGLAGAVGRAMRTARGSRDLAGPRDQVRAAIVPDDERGGGSVACVLVDLRARRRAAVAGGAAVGLAGAGAAVAAAAVAAPVLAVGAPVSLAAGLAAGALRHREVVRHTTEELEVALDALSRREAPSGALRELVRTVSRRAARPLAGTGR